MQTHARNADLQTLAELLKDQHSRKVDVVAPASAIRARNGQIVVKDTDPVMDENGVTMADGTYNPTEVFNEGVSGKLNIPTGYLKRLHTEAPDLYDANVNGLLHGRHRISGGERITVREADQRSFLVRAFQPGNGDETGIVRALLSDSYQIVDNLDVLKAALDGIQQSGADATPVTCDLTDRRMYVRVAAPGVQALAPVLTEGYRNPFNDPQVEQERGDGTQRWSNVGTDDGVFAGFDIRNSETGGGAFSIVPVVTVSVCKNGLTLVGEAYRKVHLGAKLEQGTINWSTDTRQKNLELVRAQARDAVSTFLNEEWLQRQVARLEEKAGARVDNAEKAVKHVGKRLQYSEEEINGVLSHFILGGQLTAGGVANAVTSYSQTVQDADRSHTLEDTAVRALEVAASLA